MDSAPFSELVIVVIELAKRMPHREGIKIIRFYTVQGTKWSESRPKMKKIRKR